MAQGTLVPAPKFVGLDANGNPLSGGKLTAYLAGTTTLVNTYSDVALTTPNSNPVILDSSGRATVYLTPGTSYKFVLTTSADAAVWTQDNVLAVPASAATVDTTETAGEALTAGQAVYLSDGSGGKTAGQVYKADATNTYSATLPPVGIAPSAIASGAQGTIRWSGQVTGLSSLTVGADYFVSGTAGSLTTTAPANRRLIGRADSTSSILVQGPTLAVVAPVTLGGTGLIIGTSGGVLAFTGTTTIASSALLTQYGVVVGGGAGAVPAAIAAGTTGQLLVATTSANPAFANAAASGASLVLLKANSGTDTSAGAATVDTFAITGLTAKDVLKIEIYLLSVTQATASALLQNSTDSVTMLSFSAGVAAGETQMLTLTARQSQASATSVATKSEGRGTSVGAMGTVNVAAFTQAWTGSWTIALRHGGVTAGGTLQWSWNIYREVGQ